MQLRIIFHFRRFSSLLTLHHCLEVNISSLVCLGNQGISPYDFY